MSVVGYVVNTMSVKIKQGAATAVEYQCAVTGVRENPTRQQVTTQVACPDGSKTDQGPTSWTVDVSYNVSNVPDSFHRIMRDHDGAAATLTVEPFPVQEPGHLVEYDVVLSAGGADYTVGSYGTATVTLPVQGKPRNVDPVGP
jgi:hypothetical protein